MERDILHTIQNRGGVEVAILNNPFFTFTSDEWSQRERSWIKFINRWVEAKRDVEALFGCPSEVYAAFTVTDLPDDLGGSKRVVRFMSGFEPIPGIPSYADRIGRLWGDILAITKEINGGKPAEISFHLGIPQRCLNS